MNLIEVMKTIESKCIKRNLTQHSSFPDRRKQLTHLKMYNVFVFL